MAVGLIPRYEQEFHLDGLSAHELLVIAHEAAQNLGLRLEYVGRNGLIAYTDNGMFSRNYELRLVIEGGTIHISSESVGNELFDFGRNKKNVYALVDAHNELRIKYSLEELEEKYRQLSAGFLPEQEDVLAHENMTGRIKSILSVFVPAKGFFATPLIIDLNIIMFIIMVASGLNAFGPSAEDVLGWGGNLRAATISGEWWRLFTSVFLHFGIVHLVVNMYALLYVGALLEPILKTWRFILAYILCGLAASTCSIWWYVNTVSAGASGAIFGMYGLFLALLTTNIVNKSQRKPLLISMLMFVSYSLLNGMKGNVDNAAHIGGLLTGVFIGYAFVPGLKDKVGKIKVIAMSAVIAAIVVVAMSFTIMNTHSDNLVYGEKMGEVVKYEESAMRVYDLPADVTEEEFISILRDTGIKNWESALLVLAEIDELDIPDKYKERNVLMKEYCHAWIKLCELYVEKYESDSEVLSAVEKKIDKQNKYIKDILRRIKDVAE